MQLKTVFDVLQTVYNAGINEVILEKVDGGIKIRGVDSTDSLLVYSDMDGEIIPCTFGIHRVATLLDRMKLFSFDKSKAVVTDKTLIVQNENGEECQETFIKNLTISMGRRKISFTGARPSSIRAPSGIGDTELVNKVTLTNSEGVPIVIHAMSAFGSPELVTLEGSGDEILFKVHDGISDDFIDVIGTNQTGNWSYQYRRDNLQRLIKQASKYEDSVDIGITETGIAYIIVSDITFVLLPQVE